MIDVELESSDRGDLPESPTVTRGSRQPVWKYVALVAGLAVVAGGVWAWASQTDELVPNQAELESVLDDAVAGLELSDRQLVGLETTCLKPIDECGPALVAGYDLSDVEAVCAMVQQIATRIEVAERDDDACWVAGSLNGHPIIVEVGVDTPDTTGSRLSLIVL